MPIPTLKAVKKAAALISCYLEATDRQREGLSIEGLRCCFRERYESDPPLNVFDAVRARRVRQRDNAKIWLHKNAHKSEHSARLVLIKALRSFGVKFLFVDKRKNFTRIKCSYLQPDEEEWLYSMWKRKGCDERLEYSYIRHDPTKIHRYAYKEYLSIKIYN